MNGSQRLLSLWRHKEGLLAAYVAAAVAAATAYSMLQMAHLLFLRQPYEACRFAGDLCIELDSGVGIPLSMWLAGIVSSMSLALVPAVVVCCVLALFRMSESVPVLALGSVALFLMALAVGVLDWPPFPPATSVINCILAQNDAAFRSACASDLAVELPIHGLQLLAAPLGILCFWWLGWKPMAMAEGWRVGALQVSAA